MSGRTVRCTVESMNYSACALKKGDWFEVDAEGLRMPDGQSFCAFAIASVLPLVNGRLGDDDPDEWLDSKPLLQCPDPPEALWMRLENVTEPSTEPGASA
ncbi:TIGR04076 family protein [Herbiconiux moechotypicola]|uniref:TIGR04076 family protein n=1 Tax=Herbiconiux moechotypicola TaxID=637393 RepID=A0ABP5QYR3_9MICO|nr:TIGR04076 family protein [Herbiconiux moechotypicola]MCS5731124.1 TIGR04076 family protein [Herbiconiux moechotypicola]